MDDTGILLLFKVLQSQTKMTEFAQSESTIAMSLTFWHLNSDVLLYYYTCLFFGYSDVLQLFVQIVSTQGVDFDNGGDQTLEKGVMYFEKIY